MVRVTKPFLTPKPSRRKHWLFRSIWIALAIYFCIAMALALLLVPPVYIPTVAPYDIHIDGAPP